MSKPHIRRVAMLAGTSLTWRERIMRGISSYAHEHGPWHVYTAPEGTEDSLFFSENYHWDGVIVRVTSDLLSQRVLALGLPAVSIGSTRFRTRKLPRVKVDDDKLTALAVRHLVGGGLRQFAYCTFFPRRTDEDRGVAFARQLAEQGFGCAHYSDFTKLPVDAPWQRRQRELAKWLRQLPTPVGLLAWNPDVACHVVEACHAAGVKVPEEVAVVAADEDRMKCELSSPTVTAIEIPAVRIGYEAAALLDRLMTGTRAPVKDVLLDPSGVVIARESSSTAHLQDWDVHRAAQFIREHASEPLSVPEVAERLQVSRRWLERHFRRVLGHAPHEELRRARFELARKYLIETDWPLAKVARAAGLTSAAYLVAVFQRQVGKTPMEFRQQFQA